MDQPRTRLPRPQPSEADRRPARPPQGAAGRPAGERAGSARPARPAGPRRTLPARPGAKLTGFGTGVVVSALTLLGGLLNRAFSDDLGACFGIVFVVASLAGSLWVRRADLAAAPVCAPIAFALGVAATGDSGGGFLGHLTATVTELATLTGWLYTGTLLAAAVVVARRIGGRRGGPPRPRRPARP